MSIAINIPHRNVDIFLDLLSKELPDTNIQMGPDYQEKGGVRMAVVWNQTDGFFGQFPNLELISSFGAGVDHIVDDPGLPPHAAITRIIDEKLINSMQQYVCQHVLNYQGNWIRLYENRKRQRWDPKQIRRPMLHVGVMGLGRLGLNIAERLRDLGFKVYGYAKNAKAGINFPTFSDSLGEMPAFLNSINVLINMLPLTQETSDILNQDLFYAMPRGSYIINVGRGYHLVEDDLLQAIRDEQLSGATLDVFREEPLPADHPFWREERIMITPHIASLTEQESAARIIAENYRRLQRGNPLLHTVNKEAGY